MKLTVILIILALSALVITLEVLRIQETNRNTQIENHSEIKDVDTLQNLLTGD